MCTDNIVTYYSVIEVESVNVKRNNLMNASSVLFYAPHKLGFDSCISAFATCPFNWLVSSTILFSLMAFEKLACRTLTVFY